MIAIAKFFNLYSYVLRVEENRTLLNWRLKLKADEIRCWRFMVFCFINTIQFTNYKVSPRTKFRKRYLVFGACTVKDHKLQTQEC